jgi:hypothetical protein
MANYIHHANQTLLWNTLNKLPEFQKLSPPKKDFEFKNTIEYLYNINRHKPVLTIQELQQLNRETILAFVQKPNPNPNPPLYPPSQNPQFPTFETKQEQSQRQFEERQNIYKQMNSKPDLPSPEIFKDKIEDTAIENMDALIQQYQKQREMEFQQYTPPPPISSSSSSSSSKKPLLEEINKKKIRILENNDDDDENLSLKINSIDLEATNKKNVSWSKDQNVEYVIDDYWEKKISELHDKLEEANLRINDLEQRILSSEIRQEVTVSLEKIIQQIECL